MTEPRTPYITTPATDPGCPVQFGSRLSASVVELMGVLGEVCDYRGEPYWQSLDTCPAHGMHWKTYRTAAGHLAPWRHAVIDAREVVSYCFRADIMKEEQHGNG